MPARITSFTADIAKKDYERGLTTRQICKRHGVSSAVVYHRLREAKVQSRPAGGFHRRRTSIDSQVIADEYLSGMTLQQVAGKYRVSVTLVCYRLDELGIKRRNDRGPGWGDPKISRRFKPKKGKDNPRFIQLPEADVCDLYSTGANLRAVAGVFGTSTRTIVRCLKRNDIKRRPKGFGSNIRCTDGHITDSYWESLVDEWLFEREILHILHPPLPWNSRQRADFLVGETYIELWEVIGIPSYERRKKYKQGKYRDHGLDLIELFPSDLCKSDMSKLLRLVVTPQS